MSWPEAGAVEIADAEEMYLQNFCMGFSAEASEPSVVSVAAGSRYGLSLISERLIPATVVMVRARDHSDSDDVSWDQALAGLAAERGFQVVTHSRHDLVAALARAMFADVIDLLDGCAALLRCDGLSATAAAMRTEIAVSNAIDSLKGSGFSAPRPV